MKNILIAFFSLVFAPYFLSAQYNPKSLERAEETIETFKENNAKLENYFTDAYGYIVFPSIAKGGLGIGAAYGVGTVYELGNHIGKAKLTQISIGFQLGGQDYSQLVFFETEDDFKRFKKNKIELSAQASAVAITKGASADLAFHEGIAVFTKTKGGLMYEASIAGQKLKFKPYKSTQTDSKEIE